MTIPLKVELPKLMLKLTQAVSQLLQLDLAKYMWSHESLRGCLQPAVWQPGPWILE